ncbi:MAG TPA: transcription-repair coupling factor, partial [Acidimicrobiia bacterium]|nr:transcription-repair coupling factor [Acidimicrobiia bacterium]
GFDVPRGDNEELARRLKAHSTKDMLTILVSDSIAGAERMASQLGDQGLELVYADVIPSLSNQSSQVFSTVADIEHGVVCSTLGVSIITDHELSGHRHVRRNSRGSRRSVEAYDDLSTGDYVVHHHHGVGVFEGLETKTMVGVTREYLILSFKGSDKLFVPSDQVGLVRKYIGSDKPALNRLGGADFEKARSSVRSQVNLVAQELIVLYRKRINAKGFAFSPDTAWQLEMEDLFPFELTKDQKNTVEDVKRDMELDHPMDRLVCGDVGFGKTEVALRAAFKATQDSKQVAVLVPTTLLATQHGHTFEQRFSSFGLRVEVLSRFKTVKEQIKIIDGIKDGSVDVIIGTHRLLSQDVSFKNLGLLIVDEEQRFGVNHKESIKKMSVNVDILTLTATPIPRTLEMSLTGIRDMSMITTPPADRQPILTYVHEYDERAVAEAIRRELLREGQVFFIHNRVKDLEHVADSIRDLVPEAKVVTAHGQMSENKLETVVNDFYDHKYDVLIATTIVESGLDLPAVNTLIVDRADALGLAQLYQLRGRVGRRGQRAYAYLFSPKNRALSHEAYERLKTIGEFTELGSGFKIAMRDLEIRGAGSLLGDVQSGHIAAVGFDMYCEMVTQAIDSL